MLPGKEDVSMADTPTMSVCTVFLLISDPKNDIMKYQRL